MLLGGFVSGVVYIADVSGVLGILLGIFDVELEIELFEFTHMGLFVMMMWYHFSIWLAQQVSPFVTASNAGTTFAGITHC